MLPLAPVIMANTAVSMMGVYIDVFTGFRSSVMVVMPVDMNIPSTADNTGCILIVIAAIAAVTFKPAEAALGAGSPVLIQVVDAFISTDKWMGCFAKFFIAGTTARIVKLAL